MAMYGLVQAARQWFKHLSDVLVSLGFKQCESDPCLMYRVNENGLCIILMYVDDNLIVGSNKAIDQVTEEIKNVFNVTVSPEAVYDHRHRVDFWCWTICLPQYPTFVFVCGRLRHFLVVVETSLATEQKNLPLTLCN